MMDIRRKLVFLVMMLCVACSAYADTNSDGAADLSSPDDTTIALSLLERSLDVARGLEDYQVTLYKRERVRGVLGDEEKMTLKWRHPFSVYIRMEEGKDIGQEIIYVMGEYEDKMIVSPGRILGGMTMKIATDSSLVTRNNRHLITEAGITPTLELTASIISTDIDDPKSPIRVEYTHQVMFHDMPCSLIRVYESSYAYYAEVYIFHDTLLPAAFVCYDENGELIESYRYRDYRLNIGLTEYDFDPDNDTYNF
jgi:hypothetical protein